MDTLEKLICPHCGYENRVGVLLCRSCFRLLIAKNLPSNTSKLSQTTAQLGDKAPNTSALPRRGTGTGTLGSMGNIRIYIADAREPHDYLLSGTALLLGRRDLNRGIKPDVDLYDYGAFEHGVSRCHALLRREGQRLIVQDLDSANGTYINGNQLVAHTPYPLSDGDLLRLGRLPLQVFFGRTLPTP